MQDRDQPDPVPDNPPTLWDQHGGSVVGKASGEAQTEWVTRISWREHEKVVVKSWPRCQDLDVWRSGMVHPVCVASGDPDVKAWQEWLRPAQVPHPDYEMLADPGDFRFQSIDSKLSIIFRIWSRMQVRWHQKARSGSDREVRSSERRATFWWVERSSQWFWTISERLHMMKHCSTLDIFTDSNLVGTRKCIISSMHGWRLLRTWNQRTSQPITPYEITSWGRLKVPRRCMWISSSSKAERRTMKRRPTRSCWIPWSGTLPGFVRTRTWQPETSLPRTTRTLGNRLLQLQSLLVQLLTRRMTRTRTTSLYDSYAEAQSWGDPGFAIIEP